MSRSLSIKRKMGVEVPIFKALACVAITVVNTLGVFLPILFTDLIAKNNPLKKYNCLLAGILFTSAICQMLPEAERILYGSLFDAVNGFPLAHVLVGLGFCISIAAQFTLEGAKKQRHTRQAIENMLKLTKRDFEIEEEVNIMDSNPLVDVDKSDQPNIMFMVFIFTVENILTGISLGSQTVPSIIFMLTLSVCATDWIEAVLFCMSLAVAYGKRTDFKQFSIYYATIYAVLATASTSSWVLIISLIPENNVTPILAGLTMSILAGSFMYMACKDILAKEIDETEMNGKYPITREMIGKITQFFFGFIIVNFITLIQNITS